ncbi:MAG: histidinol-phosphatase [Rhodomicrobium sp.]|nr:MAG: histidinol-phosphatase [Rhodomicrobium sp.]
MVATLSHNIDEFLSLFHEAADESGRIIRPFFRGAFSVDHKEGKGVFDPVTEADRAGEKVIRELVLSRFPDHSFVGEEMGEITGTSAYRWIVDPIDGTRSFIIGSPLWGSLIGLTYENTPLMGMMNQPYVNERFWGLPGGAFWQKGDVVQRLSVGTKTQLSDAVITTTCPDLFATKDDLSKFETLRARCRMTRFGGDCYSYCLLALGAVDLVVETGLQDYDIAPLIPIVTEAGGIVSDWQGNKLGLGGGSKGASSDEGILAKTGGQVIAASTAALHEAALLSLNG